MRHSKKAIRNRASETLLDRVSDHFRAHRAIANRDHRAMYGDAGSRPANDIVVVEVAEQSRARLEFGL